jgi:hypothetical protein
MALIACGMGGCHPAACPSLWPHSTREKQSRRAASAKKAVKPTQVVPTGSVRGGDAGFDGIQPRGLCPVCAPPVSESRRALGDAGFAASGAMALGF